MKSTKKTKAAPRVNKLKLGVEISVIIAICIAAYLAVFIPWASNQPAPYVDPYADYKLLYNDVHSYDYKKGRDRTLEERLDKGVNNEDISDIRRFFNYKARGDYYRHFEFYHSAAESYEAALEIAPDPDEENEIIGDLIECYTALGDEEKLKRFEYDEDASSSNPEDQESVENPENQQFTGEQS